MARHKQPRELAEAKGATEKDPQRYRGEPPRPKDPLGKPPSYFNNEQRAAWREIKAKAHEGVMFETDSLAVELAAVLIAEMREIAQHNRKALHECNRIEKLIQEYNQDFGTRVRWEKLIEDGELDPIPPKPKQRTFATSRVNALVGLLARFGMTPTDRNKIDMGAGGDAAADPWGGGL